MRSLLLSGIAAVLFASSVHADEPVGGGPVGGSTVGGGPTSWGETPPEDYHSPQHFSLEIKLGPYSPDIDSSPGLNGRTPFADLYNPKGTKGRPPGRVMTQLEFDWQVWHGFGSIGVGAGWGFQQRSSHAFEYNVVSGGYSECMVPTNAKSGDGNCTRSGDQTTLTVMPLELLAVYRFDVAANRWHVPLVPYFKIGLAYDIWWITNGGGSLASVPMAGGQSTTGYGGTFGWVMRPGIALQLDVLDPSAARTMDTELGINHTYLFFEMNYANITGFGAPDKLVLSDLTWAAGISFEF